MLKHSHTEDEDMLAEVGGLVMQEDAGRGSLAEGDAVLSDLGEDVAPDSSGNGGTTRPVKTDHSGRRSRMKRLTPVAAAISVSLAFVITLSLLTGTVASWLSPSSSSVTSSLSGTRIPDADIDYEGLAEIAANLPEDAGGGVGNDYDMWNHFMYFHRNKRSDECWPVPGAASCTHTLCFNSAYFHCLIMLTGDWGMTLDDWHDEITERWGEEATHKGDFDMDDGHKVIMPGIMSKYNREKYGVVHTQIEKGPGAIDRVKAALLAGHPITCGAAEAYSHKFYDQNGGIYVPEGHCMCFYRYEDGIFYAKDSCVVAGPSIPYKERGGKIDMVDWFERAGGLEEWYVDEENKDDLIAPEYRNYKGKPLSAVAKKNIALMREEVRREGRSGKRPRQVGSPSSAATTLSSSQMNLDSEDGGVTLDTEGTSSGQPVAGGTPGDAETTTPDVLAACLSHQPMGGTSAAWVDDVLDEVNPPGEDRTWSGVLACQHYAAVRASGGRTSQNDPTLSTMEAGMVVAVPATAAGGEAEGVLGHVGICVGSGLVVHDVGGSLVTEAASEFVRRYGDSFPVAWGRPSWAEATGFVADDGTGTGDEGDAQGGVPVSSIPASASLGDEGRLVVADAIRAERPLSDGGSTSVSLLGSGTVQTGGVSEGDVSWASYKVVSAGYPAFGLLVCSSASSPARAVETPVLPVSGAFAYDVGVDEVVALGENSLMTEDGTRYTDGLGELDFTTTWGAVFDLSQEE